MSKISNKNEKQWSLRLNIIVLLKLKKIEILQEGSPYGVENSQQVSGCNTGKQRSGEVF